jgi:hypothetical protein
MAVFVVTRAPAGIITRDMRYEAFTASKMWIAVFCVKMPRCLASG